MCACFARAPVLYVCVTTRVCVFFTCSRACVCERLCYSIQANSTPDTRVHVWDVEHDTVESFDFATGRSAGAGSGGGEGEGGDPLGRVQQAAEVAGRRPVAQFWDPDEPRLLVCETERLPGQAAARDAKTRSAPKKFSSAAAAQSKGATGAEVG